MARILALDIGDKRIGVALSDPVGILATPLTIIERRDDAADVAAIRELIGKNRVERVIIGLPLALDGGLGSQAEKVKAFAGALAGNVNVPLEFRDERLTTVSARLLMKEAGKKPRTRDDAYAAAVILQGYLDEITPPQEQA